LNRERRDLCQALEAEAMALLDADGPRRPAFVLLAQSHWHHGVIGIVAARLVEPLGSWERYRPDLGAKMKAQLERIAAAPGLSRNVLELVGRSLEG
jgi:single-stranded DNA-specific DHH superfamily exonuclease